MRCVVDEVCVTIRISEKGNGAVEPGEKDPEKGKWEFQRKTYPKLVFRASAAQSVTCPLQGGACHRCDFLRDSSPGFLGMTKVTG